ncbi:hypothetical protein FKG94_00095 [Exilibacterium tricleocarpae]|uniref:Uncharacterized protein n=1 Tax=Exilibacterium tricleocarpae TaxID=2591008 RepID=A0A545UBI1_9GAMM|nr:hypothetical protein [Exilibacterium tricleocarpae]TQV86783.1 hypothetical protein FKG94_00095 [Exilibacterium tricleocarpae]
MIVGTFFVPQRIYFFVTLGEIASLIAVSLTLGGWFGLVGLFILVSYIFNRTHYPVVSPRITLGLLAIGVISLSIAAQFGLPGYYKLIAFLPLICTGHLVYLGRKYLFGMSV